MNTNDLKQGAAHSSTGAAQQHYLNPSRWSLVLVNQVGEVSQDRIEDVTEYDLRKPMARAALIERIQELLKSVGVE